MILCDDLLLRERYDVIVVGAGLGGLVAASLLAKRGLSVLLIDQQHKPGGSCTSFKRDGVVYDVGTAMIYGFGERGFHPFRFLMNELDEPIDIVAHRTLARMTFEGHEIIFWPDVERFLQELDRLFPGEHDALRAFYRDLGKMYEHIVIKNELVVPPTELSARQGLRQLLASPLQVLRMQKLLSISVQDLLDRYFAGGPIIHFFDKLCSAYCYCTAAEAPAVLAATMFLDNHIGGVYYPAGGAQMLPNKLEKAFERYGGQTLYRHLVDQVLIRDGRACGVRLSGGVEIAADRVIANATVWNIYGGLVRPEHIAPERLAWARQLVPTFPSMTLYMLVDRAAFPETVMPWEIMIENRAVIDNTDLTLYINALVDQTLCPPGKLVVMAIAPQLDSWPAPNDPMYHSEAYAAHKQAAADAMLAQIERHYPGFGQHIETLIVGTPTTLERYLLKNGGAVGGPKNMLGQQMLKRLHAVSEWPGLYFCGDSTVMATGAPATAVSGVGAANMVLRHLHRPEYAPRRFARQCVRLVDLPYTRPPYRSGDPLDAASAPLAAAQCQWCEAPACVAHCPAGADLPGFMRRVEAGNLVGAARLLRERNPLAELCGYACEASARCERNCARRSFAGQPVNIAALERWVCAEAGEAGWLPATAARREERIAVLGGGAAGLTAAYYLALMGCTVEVFDAGATLGDALGPGELGARLPAEALAHARQGISASGVRYHGGAAWGAGLSLADLESTRTTVYLAPGWALAAADVVAAALGPDWSACIEPATRQVRGRPQLYIGAPVQAALVEDVAAGRRVAAAIARALGRQARSGYRQRGAVP